MLNDSTLMRELHDSGTPLRAVQILRFEVEIGYELPQDYRQFLLLRNGGRFYRNMACKMKDESWNEYVGHIELYMLDDEFVKRGGDIRFARECMKGLIPQRMLVIGGVAGGVLMIDLKGGGIYVWVQDPDADKKNSEANAVLAASSFEAFARKLEFDPDAHYHWSQVEPPFIFIERNENDKLDAYLSAGGALDRFDHLSRSPLIAAFLNIEATKILLAHGANINEPYIKTKQTDVENAATGDCPDFVQLLLSYKPSLLCGDGSGQHLLDLKLTPRIRRLLEEEVARKGRPSTG